MFADKVVLITGSSQGIGAATAIYFAKFGASLTITGRNVEKLNDVAKQCEEVGKKKPLIVAGDITDEKFAGTLLESTIKHFKKLDVLVNNAGLGGVGGVQAVDISLEQYDRIFDINLKAVYRLSKLAIPYLIQTKGNIVNVSSTAGIRPIIHCIDYSMSKAALEQFTRCLALELANKHVRVNVVEPGLTDTDFRQGYGYTEEQTQKMYEGFIPRIPMQRMASADEMASVIAFLASDQASYVTGASVPVDGGYQLV